MVSQLIRDARNNAVQYAVKWLHRDEKPRNQSPPRLLTQLLLVRLQLQHRTTALLAVFCAGCQATHVGVSENKDPTIQGTILGSPIFGNSDIRAPGLSTSLSRLLLSGLEARLWLMSEARPGNTGAVIFYLYYLGGLLIIIIPILIIKAPIADHNCSLAYLHKDIYI